MANFTHFNQDGEAIMVDVSQKDITMRIAIAEGSIKVNQEVFRSIKKQTNKKGDVLAVARIAGIMAAKKTSDMIPLCHPLFITKVTIDFDFSQQDSVSEVYDPNSVPRSEQSVEEKREGKEPPMKSDFKTYEVISD